MIVDRRALAGVLATLLLVAACGGSATQEPAATQEPTEAPDVSRAPGTAGDLEAMLPDEAGGVRFEKGSFDGGAVPGGIPIGDGDDDFARFLADNGKTLNDVRVAVASPVDAAAAGSLVMAIQIKGVPSDRLLGWATNESPDMAQTTVGGKSVYGAAAGGFGAYIYAKDDVLFYVLSMGGDASLPEEIFRQLP